MEPTLSAYNPTWRDRLASWMMGQGQASPERRQFVGGLLGSTGLGNNGVGVVDATPVGGLLGLQEAAKAGDRTGMALAAAGMVPGAGVAEKVAAKAGGLTERLAAKFPQIDFALSEAGSGPMTLSKVVVPSEMRGQGIGTQFMRDVLAHADEIGRPVALSPSSDFGGSKGKLTDWYKSLGFVPNKGRSKDFTTRETMIRQPAAGLLSEAPAAERFITAYHGSPHSFDKFDLSKIGTGEGAQAYGHGLYFADSEGVAEHYRQALQQVDTSPFEAIGVPSKDLNVASTFARTMDPSSPDVAARDFANWTGNTVTPELVDAFSKSKKKGSMYQVRINADPEHFLDWDKRLSEQPEIVQNLARNADLSHLSPANRTRRQIEMWRDGTLPNVESEPTGNVLHSALTDYGMNSANNAGLTDKLKEAGIPGIKYLDQGSRDAGTGSRNYVVFDDSLIDILKKYGLVGLLGGGAAMGAGQQQQTGVPTL